MGLLNFLTGLNGFDCEAWVHILLWRLQHCMCKVVCGPCSCALAFQTKIVINIAKWPSSSCVQILRLVPIAVID